MASFAPPASTTHQDWFWFNIAKPGFRNRERLWGDYWQRFNTITIPLSDPDTYFADATAAARVAQSREDLEQLLAERHRTRTEQLAVHTAQITHHVTYRSATASESDADDPPPPLSRDLLTAASCLSTSATLESFLHFVYGAIFPPDRGGFDPNDTFPDLPGPPFDGDDVNADDYGCAQLPPTPAPQCPTEWDDYNDNLSWKVTDCDNAAAPQPLSGRWVPSQTPSPPPPPHAHLPPSPSTKSPDSNKGCRPTTQAPPPEQQPTPAKMRHQPTPLFPPSPPTDEALPAMPTAETTSPLRTMRTSTTSPASNARHGQLETEAPACHDSKKRCLDQSSAEQDESQNDRKRSKLSRPAVVDFGDSLLPAFTQPCPHD